MIAMMAAPTLVHLSAVDLVIIAFYFLLVLAIGFYLKRFAKTGEDFFLAGREMTAWVAGLAFVSANLGSLELLGWAGSAYQYGILAAHWYWIGAIPAMVFLGIVMMPFYYISKTHSVPGYLQLRYGSEASGLSAITFAVMTILMSGVNMYAMAEGCARLGHQLQHLGVFSHGGRLRCCGWIVFGNFQRSFAIFPHLVRRAAHSHPRHD